MRKGGKLTELTIGDVSMPMNLLLKFKFNGEKYAAFTPAQAANSSDEEEVALARVIRNDDGGVGYEVIAGDGSNEVFEEFERCYEKKSSKNKSLSVLEYQRLNWFKKVLYTFKMFFLEDQQEVPQRTNSI